MLCGVCDSLEHLCGVVTLNKSACGTNYGTLSAAYAGNIAEILIERAADLCVEAAVVRADNAYILLLTSSYAAAAKDTLVVVTNEVKCGLILVVVSLFTLKLSLVYAVFKAELLELTVVVSGA